MSKKFILLTGNITAGKSTFSALLDAFPQVFSFAPWHDMFDRLLDTKVDTSSPWYGELIHIRRFRQLLSRTNWHGLECYAQQGYCLLSVGADKSVKIPFILDFYELERNIFTQMKEINRENFTPPVIMNLLYKNLIKGLKSKKYEDVEYIVICPHPAFNDFDKFFKHFPDGKVIFLKRPAQDYIYSFVQRAISQEGKTFEVALEDFFNQSIMRDNLILSQNIEKIRVKYTDNLKIIDFNDMMSNTKSVLLPTAVFLGLEPLDAYIPEVLGVKIPEATGQVFDNFEVPQDSVTLIQKYIDKLNCTRCSKSSKLKLELLKSLPYFISHKQIERMSR
jgi:dephospho-CoA kinase